MEPRAEGRGRRLETHVQPQRQPNRTDAICGDPGIAGRCGCGAGIEEGGLRPLIPMPSHATLAVEVAVEAVEEEVEEVEAEEPIDLTLDLPQ